MKLFGYKYSVFTMLVGFLLLLQSAFKTEDLKSRSLPTPVELHYPTYFGSRTYDNPDNPLTTEGIELGRMLFYEKALSANNNISCGSCHQQNRAFTDGNKFSEGTDGIPTKRNTMALVNLAWVNHFFWDGRVKGLEEQAMVPLTEVHEMGQKLDISVRKLQKKAIYPTLFEKAFGSTKITAKLITYALAQFGRTLISADAKYDHYLQGKYQLSASERRGMALFFGGDEHETRGQRRTCAHCHGGEKTFSELYHNNGLDTNFKDVGREAITGSINDKGRFRVVTLRNIALTAPYMHDGRFETLEEVIDHYSDHVKNSRTLSPFLRGSMEEGLERNGFQFTQQEKSDIIDFLHLLTDSNFVRNPSFSDPFFNQ